MEEDLGCWFRALVTEHYEMLDHEEKKDFKERYLNKNDLYLWCNDTLHSVVDNKSLFHAILNTVDFDKLFELVVKDIEKEDEGNFEVDAGSEGSEAEEDKN